MIFPNNKKFAFTIIDDTDGDMVENTKPVYQLLSRLGFKTTKTIWAFKPRDRFKGMALEDYHYRQYIKKLQREGFEIALHNVGSGKFNRQDVLDGLEIFRQFIGFYPKIQINHSQNRDSIYWGIKRFSLLRPFWRFSYFKGDDPESIYYWGDYHKKHIKFTRNFTYQNLNTLKVDPYMPYSDNQKPSANFIFSASEGADVSKFNKLLSEKNIDDLIKEGGAAIIYTHFASGFVRNGRVDRQFEKLLIYLARLGGWYAPAGDILEFLLAQKKDKSILRGQKINLELKWCWDKIKEKIGF